jgi:uncharacterized OB-fold protein
MTTLKSPEPTNATKEYWEYTKEEQLAIPYCSECEDFFFFPRSRCPICMAEDIDFRTVSGNATLVSYTTIHRAPTRNYQDMAPYVNALVDLEEGVRLMTILDVESEDELSIGMDLEVTFAETESEYKLPFFAPRER